jgi:hypothetical protein
MIQNTIKLVGETQLDQEVNKTCMVKFPNPALTSNDKHHRIRDLLYPITAHIKKSKNGAL